jgi:hypothetical protein
MLTSTAIYKLSDDFAYLRRIDGKYRIYVTRHETDRKTHLSPVSKPRQHTNISLYCN